MGFATVRAGTRVLMLVLVQATLQRESKARGVTMLVIAHRIDTILSADKVPPQITRLVPVQASTRNATAHPRLTLYRGGRGT